MDPSLCCKGACTWAPMGVCPVERKHVARNWVNAVRPNASYWGQDWLKILKHLSNAVRNGQKWVPPPRFAIGFYMGVTPCGPTNTQQHIHKGQPCAWHYLGSSWWPKWHPILGQIVGGKPQDLLLRSWSIIESCQGGVPHLFSIIGQHLKSKS